MQYDPIAEFISNLLQLAAHSTLSAYDQTPVQPLPLSTSHARNPISPFQLEQKDESRGFSVITSSLTEEQERRMDGHPWPTATPCCKTLSSHGAHAREFTCTITLLLLYTRSIYRFGGLAAPVSRGDVCVCVRVCPALWSLVAFHPRGGCPRPCPSVFGEPLVQRQTTTLGREKMFPRGGGSASRNSSRIPVSAFFSPPRLTEVSSERCVSNSLEGPSEIGVL